MAKNENGKKILIADDEKPLANALQLKLTNAGFIAKAVYDGAAAIDSIKTEKWDLLLLDLMMPKSDGFQVMKAIDEAKIKLPILVLSNLGQAEDVKKAKDLGAVNCFVKSDTPIADIVTYVKNHFKL